MTGKEKHIIPRSIYTPSRDPLEAFLLVSAITAAGILGTYFVSKFFMIFANVFWIQYTAVLSYLQFRYGHNYPEKTLCDVLLNPQVRFFLFIFLATTGLIGALAGKLWIGYLVLAAWWIFSLNFYLYFKEFFRDI